MPLTSHIPQATAQVPLQDTPDASVFLLNEGGLVLAAHQDKPLLQIGDSFWQTMHVSAEEQQELRGILTSHTPYSFLFMAGDRPAVAWCCFYSRTRLFAVWLPEGDVRRCLAAPAAYADDFMARHLILSHGALARYAPRDELLLRPTERWLRDLERPLFELSILERPIYDEDNTPFIETGPLTDLLSCRIAALAGLFGVDADADFSGLGFAPLPFPDLSWITASLFALFLTVRRAAADAAVVLRAATEGADGPVIEVRFMRRDPEDSLPELSHFVEDAWARNELFEVVTSPTEPALFAVRLSMCRKELSHLGLKVDPRLGY